MQADAGLSNMQTAKLFQVTPRTVHNWRAGCTRVPGVVVHLLRIRSRWQVPCAGWEDWHFHSGKLWSPEGFAFEPKDASWWSLLVRQARCFRALYWRSGEFERALMMLTAKGLAASDPGKPLGEDVAAAARAPAPAGASGGAAAARPGLWTGRREAPPNLLLEHFGTQEQRNGSRTPFAAIETIAEVLQDVTGASA
jgi:hypothetical protein